MEASRSLHMPSDSSHAHMSALVTAQTAHLADTHYSGHSLYQPALNSPGSSLAAPPTLFRSQSDIKHLRGSSNTSPLSSTSSTTRRTLSETSHNANQTPPNTKINSDTDGHLSSGSRITKAKLAERKKNRPDRIVRNSSGGSGKRISDSNSALDTQDLMPYRQYRARQRRDLPSGRGASVWDEELEAAFMEAIQKIPKIGRRKLPMEGKPCGRNELISEYIYKVTGVKRDRKQVSSHIQVLKGLLRNNPDFMKHVTTVEQPSSWEAENNQWDMETGSPSAQSEPTPCMNSRPLPRNRANTSGPLGDYYGTGFVSPPPSASQSSFQFTAPGLEITAFEMSAGISNSGIIEDCFHTYTKLAHQESIQQMAVHLDVIPAWRTRFPHVAELVENEDLNPNCTILHASTSIALLSSSLPSDAQLRTLVEVSIPSSAVFDNHTWECVTRIYAPGKKVWELSHPNVPQANDLDGTCKLKLPFASDFWSAFYTSLSAANQQQGGDGHDGNLKRRREKDARDAIKGITVVQELFSTALGGLGVRERSAIIMWEFTKTSGNAPGKAVWREITPFASSPSMIPQSHGMPVTTVVSLDGTELLSAVKPEHTNSWQTQYPPNIPMSPYEDPELSPSAIAHPYYTFDSNNSSAYTTAENTASVNALLASDMNMGFYPQQHHDQHQQGTYAPFVPNISGLTGAGHGEVDQYLGVGTGAAGSGGDNWPQQHQHLSPVSEAQDHGYVDLGF